MGTTEASEVWRDIPGMEGFYQASSFGNIRSVNRIVRHYRGGDLKRPGKLLSLKSKNGWGYYRVHLCMNGKHFYASVHRLVCTAFHENVENKLEVNHIDRDILNNIPSNLEWSTRKENSVHLYKTALTMNIKHGCVKLNIDQVRYIRSKEHTNAERRAICKDYGIQVQTFNKVYKHKSYKLI